MPAIYSKDYYAVLGVSRDADSGMIKKAYRSLVKKYHPDCSPGDKAAEERFKEIQEAYEVLKDPRRRLEYDTADRRRARQGAGREHGAPAGPKRRGRQAAAEVVEEIFEFLKNKIDGQRKRRGEDLRYHMVLSFEEAARGVEKEIHIPKREVCPRCMGYGYEAPLKNPVCKVCRGEGEITLSEGGLKVLRTCPACGGKGLRPRQTCGRCGGAKEIEYRVERTIKIPAGVDNGSRLRIRGEGGKGENGGEPGDLYIVIEVADHPFFRREHFDIVCEVPIRFALAALGGEIKVSTLRGEKVLRIPPGTQSGQLFVFKGYGIPWLNGAKKGDQKIRVLVEVPRDLSAEERKMIEAFDRSYQKRTAAARGAPC